MGVSLATSKQERKKERKKRMDEYEGSVDELW